MEKLNLWGVTLLVSNKFFHNSKCENGWYFHDKMLSCFDGEVFYYTKSLSKEQVEKVFLDISVSSYDYIKSINTDFSLVILEPKNNRLYLISDITGRDNIYFSQLNNSISENFWDIVNHEGYKLSDVNIKKCKEFILMLADVEHKTIVDGIEILPSASIMEFDRNSLIKKDKYWSFKLIENNLSLDEKFDLLEEALDSFFIDLKSNLKDEVFGVGVSGGLDSRLIPYYCNKHSIKVAPFIIGQEKPNILFKSNDHKRASEICEKYDLELKVHEFDNENFREKIRVDAINSPSTASQILKFPQNDLINFKHLITGASGYIVGSSPFYGSPETLLVKETVFKRQSVLKYFPKNKKIKKVLNYIFGMKFDVSELIPDDFVGILSKEEFNNLEKRIDDYLSTYKSENVTELLMNYAVDVLGQRNKMGSYESLLGQVDSYTMYGCRMLKSMQYFSSDDIFNRATFENFIRVRHPELAEIKAQDHKSSLSAKKESVINKIMNILEFTLRGRGVMNYENWVKDNKFLTVAKEQLNEYNYLGQHININSVISAVKKGKLSPQVLINILKVNEMMHIIDSK